METVIRVAAAQIGVRRSKMSQYIVVSEHDEWEHLSWDSEIAVWKISESTYQDLLYNRISTIDLSSLSDAKVWYVREMLEELEYGKEVHDIPEGYDAPEDYDFLTEEKE